MHLVRTFWLHIPSWSLVHVVRPRRARTPAQSRTSASAPSGLLLCVPYLEYLSHIPLVRYYAYWKVLIVNGQEGCPRGQRGHRAALVIAARQLFGGRVSSTPAPTRSSTRAGVTKGALYHHLRWHRRVSSRRCSSRYSVEAVRPGGSRSSSRPDSWEALLKGCSLWIDAHLDPSVQRIVLQDARSRVGLERRTGHRESLWSRGLAGCAAQGHARRCCSNGSPCARWPCVLLGALSEGCLYIAAVR